MPFLHPVPGTSVSNAVVEIQSSKTLIGSGHSKCDVVLPAERGVLDLHALLNLSTGNAAATLVPFSATAEGACFLNGRLVPAEGATVVHGDKVAFGSADNAFVFSLTEPSTKSTKSRVNQDTHSFRRTLDALRGDQAPAFSSSQSISVPKKRVAASSARQRLGTLLLDASTDSLLGDYVERKLRASASSTERSQRGAKRPAVMEPPPSFSGSTVSSVQSLLAGSILDSAALEHTQAPSSSEALGALTQSQPMLSTAERNYAEIEKLRLSQRLREVNNVLNGHLDFDSSYLMKERRGSGAGSIRFASPLQSYRAEAGNQSEEEKTEDDDDLPAMIEKPRSKGSSDPDLSRGTTALQERVHAVKPSIVSLLGKSLAEEAPKPTAESINDVAEEASPALDESLPSFSEAIVKQQSTAIATETVVTSGLSVVNATPSPLQKRRVRTQLHQRLIDRTLRQKRHEVLSKSVLRWRRALRIQKQRRRDKTHQQQTLTKRLMVLRRNQVFARWKLWALHKQQVRQCRVEALAQRQQTRLVRRIWLQWWTSTVQARQQRRFVRQMVIAIGLSQVRVGFRKWKRHADKEAMALLQQQAFETHHYELTRLMDHVAVHHYQVRVESAGLSRVFQAWRMMATQTHAKTLALQSALQFLLRRRQYRAWTTWRLNTASIRHAIQAEERTEEARSSTTQQLSAQHAKLQDAHHSEIESLREEIDKLQRQLHAHEQATHDRRKQAAANQALAKAQWTKSLEKLLEAAIAQMDTRIARVSTQLECLLQQMDTEPQAARFQAATFLVESTLQHKLQLVNEHVGAQEGLLEAIQSYSGRQDNGTSRDSAAWKKAMASSARHLHDMVLQRHARLHQLYHAVAKLAATTVDTASNGGGVHADAAKFKHAVFLTDTMKERAMDHLDALLTIHYRRCELGVVAVATEADDRDDREARKY